MSASVSEKPAFDRRRFLTRFCAGTLVAGAAFECLSDFGERNWPRIYRQTIAVPNLPPSLHGFRICQLSDFHRSEMNSEAQIRRGVELAKSLKADLIALTGDFVSTTWRNAESCAAALADLEAPHGVWGILGNHDHSTGNAEAVSSAMSRVGVQMLRNQSTRMSTGSDDWWLLGTDSRMAERADLPATLKGVPDDAFRLLLAHEPDFADDAAEHGIPLQLSGHSHGGQVLFPGGIPLVTPPFGGKYPRGLRQIAGKPTHVYTNVGMGVIIVPVRVNCPPEVSELTLFRA